MIIGGFGLNDPNRHADNRVRVDADITNLADSQFHLVAGLNGGDTVSPESSNLPGYYLRHRDSGLWLQRDDGSAAFPGDASFHRRPGLADDSGFSFESANLAGGFIRQVDSLLYVQPTTSTVFPAG